MPNTTPVHGWETPLGSDKAGAGKDALGSLAEQIETTVISTYAQVFAVDAATYGDNSTDAASHIQARVDAATAAGGGDVYLPPGTYLISAPIRLKDGVTLRGNGRASVIRANFSSQTEKMVHNADDETTGNENISIVNVTLDRGAPNTAHHAHFNGVTNLLISGVNFIGSPTLTSGCVAVSGIGYDSDLESKHVRVVGCYFEDTKNYGVQFGAVRHGVIGFNTFQNSFRGAIVVSSEGPAGVAGESDEVEVAEHITIVGNTVEGSTDTSGGTSTGHINVSGSDGGTTRHITVTANSVRNPTAVAANSNPGITCRSATDVVIQGNTVSGCNGAGILVGAASFAVERIAVIGNNVYDCNRGQNTDIAGIQLNAATHCVVSGNTVKGADHTESVRGQNSSADNLVYGNILLDATPYALTGSADTIVSGNKTTDGASTFVSQNNLTVGSTSSANPTLQIAAQTASQSIMEWLSNGVSRWRLYKDSSSESGSNAGSDLILQARNDAGSSLGNTLTVKRSSRVVTVHQRPVFESGTEFGASGPRDLAGTGTPEGAVAAPVGSTFRRSDGGTGTAFYVKETGGSTNTGWVAK